MEYKSRIGKLVAKRIWIGIDNKPQYIVYNTNFFMDEVTKEIYDSLDLPELRTDISKRLSKKFA